MSNRIHDNDNSNQTTSFVQFQDLDELKHWLISNGIDLSQWGQGSNKSVENLWEEWQSGEMYLQENPALRVVPVAQIIIRRDHNILIEAIQEFTDHRQRRRNHPPSEKIKTDENYVDAAKRCLQEELGVECGDIEILTDTHRRSKRQRESPSYPGLRTQYTFHIVEAKVRGLPETDFWTNETPHNSNDPIKRHFWVWQAERDSEVF